MALFYFPPRRSPEPESFWLRFGFTPLCRARREIAFISPPRGAPPCGRLQAGIRVRGTPRAHNRRGTGGRTAEPGVASRASGARRASRTARPGRAAALADPDERVHGPRPPRPAAPDERGRPGADRGQGRRAAGRRRVSEARTADTRRARRGSASSHGARQPTCRLGPAVSSISGGRGGHVGQRAAVEFFPATAIRPTSPIDPRAPALPGRSSDTRLRSEFEALRDHRLSIEKHGRREGGSA